MKKLSELDRQLNRLRHQKNLLWLGILLFVLVVLWIMLSIFTSSRTSVITPELVELAKPFIPRLESNIFADIQKQRVYNQAEIVLFPIYIVDEDNLQTELKLINIVEESMEPEQSITESEQVVSDATAAAELSGDTNSTSLLTPSPSFLMESPVEAVVPVASPDAE